MSAGKKINRSHEDYPEYIKKCQKLFSEYQQLIEEEEERLKRKYPNWLECRDLLDTVEKKQLCVQRNKELQKLQQEYSYLFTEEEEGTS